MAANPTLVTLSFLVFLVAIQGLASLQTQSQTFTREEYEQQWCERSENSLKQTAAWRAGILDGAGNPNPANYVDYTFRSDHDKFLLCAHKREPDSEHLSTGQEPNIVANTTNPTNLASAPLTATFNPITSSSVREGILVEDAGGNFMGYRISLHGVAGQTYRYGLSRDFLHTVGTSPLEMIQVSSSGTGMGYFTDRRDLVYVPDIGPSGLYREAIYALFIPFTDTSRDGLGRGGVFSVGSRTLSERDAVLLQMREYRKQLIEAACTNSFTAAGCGGLEGTTVPPAQYLFTAPAATTPLEPRCRSDVLPPAARVGLFACGSNADPRSSAFIQTWNSGGLIRASFPYWNRETRTIDRLAFCRRVANSVKPFTKCSPERYLEQLTRVYDNRTTPPPGTSALSYPLPTSIR